MVPCKCEPVLKVECEIEDGVKFEWQVEWATTCVPARKARRSRRCRVSRVVCKWSSGRVEQMSSAPSPSLPSCGSETGSVGLLETVLSPLLVRGDFKGALIGCRRRPLYRAPNAPDTFHHANSMTRGRGALSRCSPEGRRGAMKRTFSETVLLQLADFCHLLGCQLNAPNPELDWGLRGTSQE